MEQAPCSLERSDLQIPVVCAAAQQLQGVYAARLLDVLQLLRRLLQVHSVNI